MMRGLALAVFIVVVGCRDHRVIEPTLALPAPGTALPRFTLPLQHSGTLTPERLAGAPAVLFLWSSHCPTSRRALTDYRDVQRRYTARGIKVVLLTDDASADDLALFPRVLADSGITGDVALAHGTLANLFDRSATAPERDTARVLFVLPAYLVVGPNGRVETRSWGPDASMVRTTLDSLIAHRPAA
jgi:peroxiredoxin